MSTDRDKLVANKLAANQQFCHIDFVTVISSQSEGLGKMAPETVKYFYERLSQPIGVIWFAVSLFAVSYLNAICYLLITAFYSIFSTHTQQFLMLLVRPSTSNHMMHPQRLQVSI